MSISCSPNLVHFAELILKDTENWAGLFDQFAYTTRPWRLLHWKVKIQNWPEPAQFKKGLQVTSAFCCWRSAHTFAQTQCLSFLAVREIMLELPPALAGRWARTPPVHHSTLTRCSTNTVSWVAAFSVGEAQRLWTQAKTCPRRWQSKNFKDKIQKLYSIPLSFSFWKTFPNSGITQDKLPDIFQVCIKGMSHCPAVQNTLFFKCIASFPSFLRDP